MTTKITRWQDRPWDSPWVDEPWTTTMAATITEIGIGRDMCYGSCPVYALSLERSGIARFHGHSFVDMDGAHLAQIDPQDFALLALAIEHLGFAALEPGYRSNITCLSTTTTWVRRGDVRQEVDAYGWRPEALGVIEDLIDSAASELTWRSNGGRPTISVGMSAGDVDPGDRTHWTQRRHGGRLQWLVEATLDEAGLTGRERKVLELRFGLEDGRPRTVAEVATVLGVSAARIRQIEAKALKALRGSRGPAGGG